MVPRMFVDKKVDPTRENVSLSIVAYETGSGVIGRYRLSLVSPGTMTDVSNRNLNYL